jgi:hypothetical protein
MSELELIRNDRADPKYQVPPQYVIRLKHPTVDGEGQPFLTKRCESLPELDAEIDAIKAKLDWIKTEAHRRWGQTADSVKA